MNLEDESGVEGFTAELPEAAHHARRFLPRIQRHAGVTLALGRIVPVPVAREDEFRAGLDQALCAHRQRQLFVILGVGK